MRKISTIAFAGLLALVVVGCSSDEKGGTPDATPPKSPPKAQAFANPVVSPNPALPTAVPTANLIETTNSKERIGVVPKGRPDPFAQITGSIPVGIMTSNAAPRPIPQVPPLPTATVRPTVVINRTTTTTTTTTPRVIIASRIPEHLRPPSIPRMPLVPFNPVRPSALPPIIPNPTLISVLPPAPQPELARSVSVTGVLLVGQEPQAIVKVPEERSSRYVRAGQRLANGVLVKRIQMNEGSDPIVIFEQFGIEVARTVGEPVVKIAQPNSPNTVSQNPVSSGV